MWQYDKMTDSYIPGMVPSEGQITACYTRLSQEDEQAGDSDSILNQEKACGILASLSLAVEAHDRMMLRGGSLRWIYLRAMEHHFKRAIFDTLRLLQILTHDTHIASEAIYKEGYRGFIKVTDSNINGLDLEQE